jgi:hypothetical protein
MPPSGRKRVPCPSSAGVTSRNHRVLALLAALSIRLPSRCRSRVVTLSVALSVALSIEGALLGSVIMVEGNLYGHEIG